MVSVEQQEQILQQLSQAKASFDISRKEIADMRAAGLTEEANRAEALLVEQERVLNRMLSVYGRKS